MATINDVRSFWENNPLFAGESQFEPGSKEFFEEGRKMIINDNLAGKFDERALPKPGNREHVLDLGCGPGFWTIEFLLRGAADKLTAADLTEKAQELTRKRLNIYGLSADVCYANAEDIPFDDNTFSHVNCQGVIHHTPDTEQCVREIARVLKPGGTASLSVYYRNIIIRNWPRMRFLRVLALKAGLRLPGRGRETIVLQNDVNELIKTFDGADNPVGKVFSKREFVAMLEPYFEIEGFYYHLFPARAFPFRIPKSIHRLIERCIPFLIYVNVRKSR